MYKRIVFQSLAVVCAVGLGSAPAAAAAGTTPTKANLVSGAQQSRDQWGAHIVSLSRTLFDGKVVSKANCANEPSYTCTGLMLSGFEAQGPDYWFSTNPDNNKFSMSYVIKSTARGTGHVIYGGSGYIMWPSSTLAVELAQRGLKNNAFPAIYRCAFVQDAFTTTRTDSGCGDFRDPNPSDKAGPCQAQGIKTAAQWLETYGKGDLVIQQCGFTLQVSPAADKQAFNAAEEAQKALLDAKHTGPFGSYNEIVMAPWPELQPARVPLFAFFYVAPDTKKALMTPDAAQRKNPRKVLLTPEGDLDQVKRQQLNYYNKAKVFAPIIRMSGNSWEKLVLSYKNTDQSPGIPATVTVLPQ
ncbi:hypothetical protein [Bordetella sp. LUAb4]|uniref:hypothetical protein n=1 Tax=Bordetella sp. LUAb4 TaxID=2843195 RepID=UPI001E5F2B02|nr:hypothetical protein [Bordetella sp. LUAb4]